MTAPVRTVMILAAVTASVAAGGLVFAQSIPSISSVRSAASEARAVVDDVRYVAGAKDWATIGRKGLTAGTASDRIAIDGEARYAKLRLCALAHPLALTDLTAEFHNGTQQKFANPQSVETDKCTPTIDLAGKNRDIDAVAFTITAVVAGSEPEVVIQAR